MAVLRSLTLTYRGFANASLEHLGQVNVLVGANNAGKSSIFHLTHELCDAAQTRTLQLGELASLHPRDARTELQLEFSTESSLAWREPFAEFAAADASYVIRYWGSNRSEFIRSPKPPRLFREEADGLYDIDAERPTLAGGKNSPKGYCSLYDVHNELNRFFSGFFFLHHVRGGGAASPIAAYPKLDSDARHVAGRLDHLLGERTREFREQLDAFMNAVLPGIGQVCTQRSGQGVVAAIVDGKSRLPLAELGGGVEQVLTIALILIGEPTSTVLFIEEPENHLHEAAQRRLIGQIEQHVGKRQVFIATHSPVFMNSFTTATVFRIGRTDSQSVVEVCISPTTYHATLDELGVLPSSLLQTNCVVWVEGPTERVLIAYWIGMLAPELKEHEHFEFVMTAGSLLTHIGNAGESEMTQMAAICRNSYAVCDRDSGADESPAKTAVRRVAETLGDDQTWITCDHEIEWYFPPEVISGLWPSVAPATVLANENRSRPFYRVLEEALAQEGTRGVGDKVTNARRAVKLNLSKSLWFGAELDNSLANEVARLSTYIRRANLLEVHAVEPCASCGASR